MDLAKLRSATIIEDAGDVFERLKKAHGAAVEADPGVALTMELLESDRGALVRKSTVVSQFTGVDTKAEDAPDWKVRQLAEARGIKWDEALKDRAVAYWMSDERPDKHGDIVRQNWDLQSFRRNPVMPWCHMWDGIPVGNIISEEVKQKVEESYSGPALWGLALFAMDVDGGFIETVFRLASSGFLRNGSVGFMPKKIIEIADEDEREELGLGRHGLILDENELIEFSPCTIGANPGATTIGASLDLAKAARAKARGKLKANDFQLFRELERQRLVRLNRQDDWKKVDADVVRIARALFASARLPQHEDVTKPVEILEPAERLRMAVRRDAPKDESARLDRIQESLDELKALVSETLTSISTRTDDILAGVERIAEHVATEQATADPAGGEGKDLDETDAGETVDDDGAGGDAREGDEAATRAARPTLRGAMTRLRDTLSRGNGTR